ncbi:hypothetical protein [Nonomuraea longispora]|nr:hypothetical protein [Nonomuraea longispora]
MLTLGLIGRWGEVFPRWIPMLRGRPVLAYWPRRRDGGYTPASTGA